MIPGLFVFRHSGLRFERLDVGDDIANRIFVSKPSRHRTQQSPLAILGTRAANAAPKFSQLRGEVPVVHSSNPRSPQVLVSGSAIAVAGTARRVKRLSDFRIAGK